MSTEPVPQHVRIAIRVGELLDHVGLRHMACGSIASSLHGEPRSTNDIDFVVDYRELDAARLAAAVSKEFFADEAAIRSAAREGSSCNLVHRATGIKVDLFRLRDRDFSRMELQRCTRKLAAPPDRELSVASPEDMILTKLEWYRKGGETSDRQWRDVRGLLKLQAGRLDMGYLGRWAIELGIEDLLARVRAE